MTLEEREALKREIKAELIEEAKQDHLKGNRYSAWHKIKKEAVSKLGNDDTKIQVLFENALSGAIRHRIGLRHISWLHENSLDEARVIANQMLSAFGVESNAG